MGNSWGNLTRLAFERWCVKWWVFKNKTRIFFHFSYSILSILCKGATVCGGCEPLHVVSFRIGVGLKSSKPTEAQNKKAKRLRQISGTMAFAGLVFATASSIWSLGTWGLVGSSTGKINTSISSSVLLQDVTSWQRSTRGFIFLTYPPGNNHISPTVSGTFQSMMFPFPQVGGICDRSLESC